MYVVEGLNNKEFTVMPIDGKLRMIIRQIMESEPLVEIEIEANGIKKVKAPKEIASDKQKLKYAVKRDVLLQKAKKVAKDLVKEAQKTFLRPHPRQTIKIEALKRQLIELKKLLDKYEKFCRGHVVFVKGDYIKKVAPAKEELSVMMHPDFLQLLLYIMTSH